MIWWLEHGPCHERREARAFVLMCTANEILGPDPAASAESA